MGLLMGYPLVNVYKKLLKMAIEIVSFPINSMVIFHSYVKLPEGKHEKCRDFSKIQIFTDLEH